MGIVEAEITLKNAGDVINVGRGIIPEGQVRQITVQSVVDTGAATLIINEKVCQMLGLQTRGIKQARMANDTREAVRIVETVEVHWKNRSMTCQPWVIDDSTEILLGAIPLEDMDLIIDPSKQELAGAHGEEMIGILY